MVAFAWLVVAAALLLTLSYHRVALQLSTAAVGVYLVTFTYWSGSHWGWPVFLWVVFVAATVPLNLPLLRRRLLSARVLRWFRQALPAMSQTEREALEAGTVWWDAELFTGAPDWNKLQSAPPPKLSADEQAFLDGPVETLCQQLDEWDIVHRRMDLPPEAWRFIKENGFWGMIIPKQYGGKGFSALAHSAVIMKLGTRSPTAAITVMVPNSLGPAELLMRYGTDGQREQYLPRLADGREIPCFALTGPEAGSDAGSMPDTGIVCRGEFQGEEVLGLRLNWEKRYITLGPVATLLGLAFKAYDPDHLLGETLELGITLALIPTDTPGIEIGNRHLPMNWAFMNGPNRGRDVFIPMDCVIGGQAMLGQGWRMLMNSLSVGRSISLPATATGAAKMAALLTGCYARIRRQFDRPIGSFEGVQEVLARLAGNAYLTESARRMTAGAVDLGEQPSVISAIVKYHLTERMRASINDAMDVHGGRGIIMGQRNYLGLAYQGIPISITVEGANLLTRNMIIFGQGAIRCHPYLLKEMQAARSEDTAAALKTFDKALFGHAGYLLGNAVRGLLLGLTGGRLAGAPVGRRNEARPYYKRLTRMAAVFALVADVSLLTMGGELKRRERLSSRLGDLLSNLYLASAALKRFDDDGRPKEDLPLLEWALRDTLHRFETALDEVLRDFPSRGTARALRVLTLPLGRKSAPPDGRLDSRVAALLVEPGPSRNRLTEGIFRSEVPDDPQGRIEFAFTKTIAAEAAERRIDEALRKGQLDVPFGGDLVGAARKLGLLDDDEERLVREARDARREAIMVDEFSPEALSQGAGDRPGGGQERAEVG